MTIEQIAEKVHAALPLGSTLVEADRYFSDNHIEHSFYRPKSVMYAAVRNIKGGVFPVDKGAQIIVEFDRSERVSSVDVTPIYTGP